jgi:hypothetical protein
LETTVAAPVRNERQQYRNWPTSNLGLAFIQPQNSVVRAGGEEPAPTVSPPKPQAQIAVFQPAAPPAEKLPPPDPQAPVEPSPLSPAEVIPSGQLLPDERPICQLTTGILPSGGEFPEDVAATRFNSDIAAWMPRPWEGTVYYWDAPDYCHRPLYYEEVNLERYGYSHCPLLQPAISGAHFFCATLALPYNSTVHPPHECIYPLGHYRPGSPVPYRIHRPEWDPKAAAMQAGAVGGLILLIP